MKRLIRTKEEVIKLLEEGNGLRDVSIMDVSLSGVHFTKIDIINVQFINITMEKCYFESCFMSDVSFSEVVFNGISCLFQDVRGSSIFFRDCYFESHTIIDSIFVNSFFMRSKGRYIVFYGVEFINSVFENSVFEYSVFMNTNFLKTDLRNTRLCSQYFSDVVVKDSNFCFTGHVTHNWIKYINSKSNQSI